MIMKKIRFRKFKDKRDARSLRKNIKVIACLDSAVDDGYLNDKQLTEFLEISEKLANQLIAFRISLLKNPTK